MLKALSKSCPAVTAHTRRAPFAGVAICLALQCLGAPAAAEKVKLFQGLPGVVNEEVLELPGDPRRPVTLEVTLLTPDGRGPFPLAVMNHGSADPGQAAGDMPRYRNSLTAYYFLSRGYAVVMPMMRGFGGSGGALGHYGCDMTRMGLDNARDIDAVITALAGRADIDSTRLVVAGVSMGGWNTLALGAEPPPNLRALVNFSGGVRASTCDDQDRALARGAAAFGRRSHTPSIWFYGDNDRLFPVSTWSAMHDDYVAAGGEAQMVDFGVFGADAHKTTTFPEALALWTPSLDAFLGRLGLPHTDMYPQYLPAPPLPPSHFAAIDDAAAVPYLNDKGRALYTAFLAQPLPRAFVISPHGAFSRQGGIAPDAYGLELCRAAWTDCGVYAYDNDVVWTGPGRGARAPPRQVQISVKAGVTSTLIFAYALNPDCTSRGSSRLWVSQDPAHGVTAVIPGHGFPSYPPASPFAVCNSQRAPGMALTYAPVSGFSGADTLTLEETTVDGEHKVFRLAITVQ